MFELPDSMVWDFWLADDGTSAHLFFLFASRALHDPDARHRRASIGHAIGADLRSFDRTADALVRSDAPAFDDVATWTGSCVRGDDGGWHLFYTGLSDDPAPGVQRVSSATSADLITWRKTGHPLTSADDRWYATARAGLDEPWRDPWVFRGDDGLWHMLVTASSNADIDRLDAGVLGHATSPDLRSWTVLPPLSEPGAGFGQIEVPQVIEIDGEHLLVFSCLEHELHPRRSVRGGGGVWVAAAGAPLGPYDLENAVQLTDASRYAGRVVRERNGEWMFLAFRNVEDGRFVGAIADPVPFRRLLDDARSL